MLVDYLRYVAFGGRLRAFFNDGLYNYVDPTDTTGQHLRFAPEYLQEQLGWRGQSIIHDLYWQPHSRELLFERLKHDIGITGGADTLAQFHPRIGDSPLTFAYKELRPPELEIIVDIKPAQWVPRYAERRLYEGVPVVYRRAGPATANMKSGDRVFDERLGPSRYGTLCGVFRTSHGQRLALTCGHVAEAGSHVLIERRWRLWRLPVWSHFSSLGRTSYSAICDPGQPMGRAQAQLDAALITVGLPTSGSESSQVVRQATIKPIATILQEEPVQFRGGGRPLDTLARVSAVTVRKSIDLFNDGHLRDVGDVLMLGHRHPMYIAKRVSRPGDSGAAVRQGFSSVGPFTELNQWHGMILGSDDSGAFATHAEHLWAWAAQETGDLNIEFDFEP